MRCAATWGYPAVLCIALALSAELLTLPAVCVNLFDALFLHVPASWHVRHVSQLMMPALCLFECFAHSALNIVCYRVIDVSGVLCPPP